VFPQRQCVSDVSNHALILEVVGDHRKLVALEQILESYGILEIVAHRQGALERASGVKRLPEDQRVHASGAG